MAAVGGRPDFDVPSGRARESASQGEAEAGAVVLSVAAGTAADSGFEDQLALVVADTGAVVVNVDLDSAAGPPCTHDDYGRAGVRLLRRAGAAAPARPPAPRG